MAPLLYAINWAIIGGSRVPGSRVAEQGRSPVGHIATRRSIRFELGSKDTELRGEVFEAETYGANPKNLEISEHPVPKAEDPTEPADTLENWGIPPHTPHVSRFPE